MACSYQSMEIKMANYTRTNGANAQAPSWDDFDESPRTERRAAWLPLDILTEPVYESSPPLRTMPAAPAAPRRSIFGPRQQPQPSPTTAHPNRQRASKKERQTRTASSQPSAQTRVLAPVLGVALTLLAAYAAISTAVDWTETRLNDLQYGRPRTAQIDAFVGHNEADGVPTHFVALNLNRRVTVLEMPGGDSTKASAIVGPYLFGSGEDLTPVQVATQDVNSDGKPDLVVSVKNEQLVYLNDGTSFRLMTPEERAALQKAIASPSPKEATAPNATPGVAK